MTSKSIRFGAVGDVSLGDHPLCVGFGGYSEFRKRPASFPFNFVKTEFDKCDVLFGNLECAISQSGVDPRSHDSVQMRGQAGFVDALSHAGFTVMNMANNHSLQHGEETFLETRELLLDNEIQPVGVSTDSHRTAVPTVTEAHGVKLGFLGYSLRPRQYFENNPIYSEGSREGILRDTRLLRSNVDCVIVSLHWGDEFIHRPSPEEIQLAHEIIDAGAKLIIGHHPHVLRGIEHYGEGVIAYSLGNFVCDMLWDEALRETAILQCNISKTGISDLALLPCRIGNKYQPIPIEGPQLAAALDRIAKYSTGLSESIGSDIRSIERRYEDDANSVLRIIRRKSQFFFLKNIVRYRTAILLQQVMRYFRNRIHEFAYRDPKAEN